ncbi:MAG: hypothetical protein ACHQUC_06845 [Chlamydiales bacterium]
MTYDDKLAALFLMNFKESYRSAKLLMLSHARVSDLIPLTGTKIKQLSIDELDKLDAFRVRFCDLQDSLGSKTFRTLLKLEEENIGTQLDIINKIEKRRIISSFEGWKNMREIRNLFSHDYPENDEQLAEAINIAYKNSAGLISVLNNVKLYVQEHIKIPMHAFPLISQTSDERPSKG